MYLQKSESWCTCFRVFLKCIHTEPTHIHIRHENEPSETPPHIWLESCVVTLPFQAAWRSHRGAESGSPRQGVTKNRKLQYIAIYSIVYIYNMLCYIIYNNI